MDYESEIAKLAATAEPLRKLDDDDPKKEALTVIVDKINALRAKQAAEPAPVVAAPFTSTLSVQRK